MQGIESLGSFLRAELARRGWEPIDLANASGVPKATVHNLLKGKVNQPDNITLSRIAHGLGISLRVLLERLGYSLEGESLPSTQQAALAAVDRELARIADLRDELAQRPELLEEARQLIRFRLAQPKNDADGADGARNRRGC